MTDFIFGQFSLQIVEVFSEFSVLNSHIFHHCWQAENFFDSVVHQNGFQTRRLFSRTIQSKNVIYI